MQIEKFVNCVSSLDRRVLILITSAYTYFMKLDERKEHILDFIVRDYIRTASSVSSGRVSASLNKKPSLAGSPATVRNIMMELDEEGFLHQPHTSSGRAPTDRGYRYFVDNLMSVREPAHNVQQELDRVIDKIEKQMNQAFGELSRSLAGHLQLFSGFGVLEGSEKIFGYGLSEVLKEPEFDERNLAAEFADFIENIEDNLENIFKKRVELVPEISISGFGAVSVFFEDDNFGECVVFSIGPKRMNYEKAASLLKYAAEDIKGKKFKKHHG